MKETVDLKFVDEVITRWYSDPAYLIPMMQDIQTKFTYLPRPALVELKDKLNLPLVRVSEVATFYRAMSLKPKGKHQVHVCLGTACHLKGGPRIVDAFKRELDVEVDETTKDGEFTLETVNCVGACALAPVVIVDGNVTGRLDASKVKLMISRVQRASGIAPAAPAKPEKAPAAAKAAPEKSKGGASPAPTKPARTGRGKAGGAKKVAAAARRGKASLAHAPKSKAAKQKGSKKK
jgi:NADH-quinone oxidoreductase subunit E